MSKHTPGPWEAEKTSGAYVVCELTSGWSVVATNADPNKYSPEDDARLIAAAPVLLEALEHLYSQSGPVDSGDPSEWHNAMTQAENAIIKAHGETK